MARSMDWVTFDLSACLRSGEGWGHELGREAQRALRACLSAFPSASLVFISLGWCTRLDASFCRKVVEVVRSERGRVAFCLVDIQNEDVLENWDAVAWKCDLPLFAHYVDEVWQYGPVYHHLGPPPRAEFRAMFDYVLSSQWVCHDEASAVLGLEVSHASRQLQALWMDGYVLRKGGPGAGDGGGYRYTRFF